MHQRPPRHGWGTENTRQFVSRRASRRSQDKKKKKKKAFDEEKNDDDARGKVWKARAADATGRGGRDARRWEATSCVRPRAPAVARARGSWPPRRRAASGAGRAPRRSPSRRPIFFHRDLMSLRCRRARPRPSPSPSISSNESPLPPRAASARRDAGRVPLACPRARMSAATRDARADEEESSG